MMEGGRGVGDTSYRNKKEDTGRGVFFYPNLYC